MDILDDETWNSKYSFFKVRTSPQYIFLKKKPTNFWVSHLRNLQVNIFAVDENVFCFSPFTTRPGENESLMILVDDPADQMASQPTLTIELVIEVGNFLK